MNVVLLIIGGAVITFWGVGHLYPTRSIVAGFGQLSDDNRCLILMEWIAEGLTLIFIGLLALGLTLGGQAEDTVGVGVYRACAVMLLVLAALSSQTGAKTSILPMRLCPFIKTGAAVLLLLGTVV